MSSINNKFFIAFLVFIVVVNIHDFYNDFIEYEHNTGHLIVEAIFIVASFIGIVLIVREIQVRRCENENLQNQLNITRSDLSKSNSRLQQISREFGKAIQEQFSDWELTPSEKEVGLLLLKGLSFDEISSVRDTKEKTVRQQATSIYRKSGLNGRHAFAAWFFEDLLE